MITDRAAQGFFACCLTLFGFSVFVLRRLADPQSRISRFVDRNVLPYGVTR